MPTWAWVVISLAVGVVVMALVSILAITFLGESAETRFQSVGSVVSPAGELEFDADTYGDDPELDALWDRCDAGSGSACDELFWSSPIDSDYEDFGASCGNRFAASERPLSCEDELGR
jgi:hypothetical protein